MSVMLAGVVVAVFLVGYRVGRLMREAELVDELRRVEVVGRRLGSHVVFGAEADTADCGQSLRRHLVEHWPVIWEAVRHE